MHWQFSIDKNGHVYISAGGGMRCARFENGRYLAPELLPAPILVEHSAEDKYRAGGMIGPFISPEGDYLILYADADIPAFAAVDQLSGKGTGAGPNPAI